MTRYHLAVPTNFPIRWVPPGIGCGLASLVGEVLYLSQPRARNTLKKNIYRAPENITCQYTDQWYPFRRLWV